MNDFIALIFPLECGECRDSATLSDSLKPVTRAGWGRAGPGPTKNRDIGLKMFVIYHGRSKLSFIDFLFSALL